MLLPLAVIQYDPSGCRCDRLPAVPDIQPRA
jgi:hypothetical protein